MKTLFKILTFTSIFWVTQSMATPNPEGYWKSYENGKLRSIIQVTLDDQERFSAKIIKLFFFKGEQPIVGCVRCLGQYRNYPIVGFPLAENFEKYGNQWEGRVLDPSTGLSFSAIIKINDAGDRITMRAYWMISLLGQTYEWARIKNPSQPK